MRRSLAIAAALATLGALAIPALAATRSVKVGDNYFVRRQGVPTVTVRRGDTVRWNFAGHRAHNVAVRSGPVRFRSPTRTRGSYSRRLTRGGTYRIYCQIHGSRDQSMILKVR
ncbi:MAG: hypothetical protein M3296_09260 [Actinomycetota bacterium]|nr:hypothetical protein [Actinomycetota bacterium]